MTVIGTTGHEAIEGRTDPRDRRRPDWSVANTQRDRLVWRYSRGASQAIAQAEFRRVIGE
jgi:hypothetical protein